MIRKDLPMPGPKFRDGPQPQHAAMREPATVGETGLSWELLFDLAARHLYAHGAMSLARLAQRLGLKLGVVQALADRMYQQGLLQRDDAPEPAARYDLSDSGDGLAKAAYARGSYCGAAPVPLDQYREMLQQSSVRGRPVRSQDMRAAFDGVIVADSLLDAFGRGLNSDRAMLIYGPTGSGKTYLAQRLVRALHGPALIPHAIAIANAIVPIHNPVLHEPWPAAAGDAAVHDGRYAHCRRPGIICGAQLTPEMLELRYDPLARRYHAPLQLLANGGVLVIDDLGRQRTPVAELLNRWIVPLETQQDWLALDGGASFSVPFDLVLILASHLEPDALDAEACRRRVGHKVRLQPIEAGAYAAIWRQSCERRGLPCNMALVHHAIEELHGPSGVPLLPCHPDELLSLMLDQSRYAGTAGSFDLDMLDTAWTTCFPDRAPLPAGTAVAHALPAQCAR